MRKLLWFTVFFAASVLAFVLGTPPVMLYAAAGTAAVAVIVCLVLRLRFVRICALGLCLGVLWCAAYEALFLGNLRLADGSERMIHAEAVSYSEPTRYGASVKVKAKLGDREHTALVYYDDAELSLKPGDTFACKASVEAAADVFDVDESLYDRSRGVWLRIYAKEDLQVTRAESLPVSYLPTHVSYLLRQKITQLFSDETGGFLSALLTGNKSGLDFARRESLSRSGIYHAVAVSGMHVSILLGMVLILTGERRRLGAAIGLPLAIFFVLMTGASASAVRAGCMQALLLLAPLLGRENDPPTSVAAALLFLLVLNPWSIMSVGLQLSFAAVCGILLFSGRIYHPISQTKLFKAVSRIRVIGWLARQMLAAFSSSVACAVFSLPLVSLYFGRIPIVMPLTNALVLWAVTFCFAGGLIVCLVGFCSMPAASVLAWLVDKPTRYVLAVSEWLGDLPYAAVSTDNPYWLIWCAVFYLAMIVWALRGKLRLKTDVLCLILSFILTAGLSKADGCVPNFVFTAFDVGEGQCLVWQSKAKTAVIDCGGSYPEETAENAAMMLQSAGRFCVDALILTHSDEDHTGGVEHLLSRMDVRTIYMPEGKDERTEELVLAAEKENAEVIFVREDVLLELGGGKVELFAPVTDETDNAGGICVLASAEEYDILVTGDLPIEAEMQLLQTHELPDIEVLIAGHHGAQTSTGYAILHKTAPETVLISTNGKRYNHPSEETLRRIARSGAEILRTDECGNITIRG